MSWRWISLTALLAAVVVSYGIFVGQPDDVGLTPGTQRTQPGYYLENAIVTDMTAEGTPGVRLAAERIQQIPEDNSIALTNVQVDYLALREQRWRLTADAGIVPAGSTTITFSGDVTLESEDQPHAAVIHTDTLSIDTRSSVASTAAPVSIEVSGHRVHARGMIADLEENRVELESNVNGRFVLE